VAEQIFRARWIFPICQPPIERGWVMVRGHEVVAIGSSDSPPTGVAVEDLGDAAILPGLVNAHTHLEFSDLTEPVGFTGIKLHQWIELVLRRRKSRRRDPGSVIAQGLVEAAAGGARLVAEIATTPWAGFRKSSSTEAVVFAEVLGLSPRRADERIAAAEAHLAKAEVIGGVAGAISPHAPYSTSAETVRRCVDLAKRRNLIVAMHIAESSEERELIERGTGPFAAQLKEMGVYQASFFGRGETATSQFLEELARAPAALVIHGNDLQDREIEVIKRNPQMSVVYCPRTHAFFGYPAHPFDRMMAAGIRVALGTDSRASNPDLSIWNEVRWLLEHRPDVHWQNVLAMATMDGADALRRPDLGRIQAGCTSGLIAVSGHASRPDDLVAEWVSGGAPRILTSADGDGVGPASKLAASVDV
jgi:aminodeoxyfutalosine deaminase